MHSGRIPGLQGALVASLSIVIMIHSTSSSVSRFLPPIETVDNF